MTKCNISPTMTLLVTNNVSQIAKTFPVSKMYTIHPESGAECTEK